VHSTPNKVCSEPNSRLRKRRSAVARGDCHQPSGVYDHLESPPGGALGEQRSSAQEQQHQQHHAKATQWRTACDAAAERLHQMAGAAARLLLTGKTLQQAISHITTPAQQLLVGNRCDSHPGARSGSQTLRNSRQASNAVRDPYFELLRRTPAAGRNLAGRPGFMPITADAGVSRIQTATIVVASTRQRATGASGEAPPAPRTEQQPPRRHNSDGQVISLPLQAIRIDCPTEDTT